MLLLAGNYFVAAVISLILFIFQADGSLQIVTVLSGMLLGLMFIVSFFAFARAVALAGTALATISSRLSVVIPTAASMIFLQEVPGQYQWPGYVLALLTLYLFFLSIRDGAHQQVNWKGLTYLLFVFIGIGINDFSLKLFNAFRAAGENQLFLFSIFSSAFVYALLWIFFKKIRLERRTVLRGAMLGIPNMFSSFFLIKALLVLPAVVVYPMVNIGIILFTLAGAWLIWREQLNRFGVLALVSGAAAIILMSI